MAGPSPWPRSIQRYTSNKLRLGTTRPFGCSMAGAKQLALGPSVKYSIQPDESTSQRVSAMAELAIQVAVEAVRSGHEAPQ